MACTRVLGRPILVGALVFYSPRVMPGVRQSNQRELETLEIMNLLVIIGIFSCVSVIYTNSRRNNAKMDEIVDLLRKIADKS